MPKIPPYRKGKAGSRKTATSGTTVRLPGKKPKGGNKGANC